MHKDRLAGFAQHGVRLTRGASGNARAEACPFCGSSSRSPFTVNEESLLWNCVAGGEGGDFSDFLGLMQQQYAKQLDNGHALALQTNRGIHESVLRAWGIGWKPLSEEYAIPFRADGKITNIRLWRPGINGFNTANCKSVGLFLCPDVDVAQSETVWICEGEWDAMVIWTALRKQGVKDAVIGLNGATSFPSYLAASLGDKTVILLFDNDLAGQRGETKARRMLGSQPRGIAAVRWPEGTKPRYDVRDLWKAQRMDPAKFLSELCGLLDRALPGAPARSAPEPVHEIVQDGVRVMASKSQQELAADVADGACPKPTQPEGPGLDRDEMIERYRKWLLLPSAEVLDVMFGTLLANRLDGAPLWLFLVGPPGCGKTELIMSTHGAPLVASASTMSVPAMISGTPNTGMGDPSLIPKWNGKTVAFKDFTVILTKQPKERDEIFGILRGAYDGLVEKGFGNVRGVVRYRSRFGILSGVTAKIEEFGPSHSDVGERFLKFYMRTQTALRSGEEMIKRALKNCDVETAMREELRETARATLDRKVVEEDRPSISEGMETLLVGLAMWTANLRGAVSRDKYTGKLQHVPQAEIGTRLVKQFKRLAAGIAILKRSSAIGMDEYKVASHVARFSVPDMIERVVHVLYVRSRSDYASVSQLCEWTRLPTETIAGVLIDLRLLKVVKNDEGVGQGWKLTDALIEMMEPLGLYTRERVVARR